jgi:hypothetical protein
MSRRDALKYAAATPALIGLVSAAESLPAPSASADGLGVLLDYAAGVIPADQIRAAGAVGSIRYVSDRRPGGAWMLGKPMQINAARDLHRVAGRILPPICIKWRSTSATSAASAWISITSASRNSASGPDLYSPVTFQQTSAERLVGRFLNSRTAPSCRLQAARSEMAQIF